jgi:hypothetical protein
MSDPVDVRARLGHLREGLLAVHKALLAIPRADELVEEDEPPAGEASALATASRELLAPDEAGTGFAKRYFHAIQASPDVVLAHAAARRRAKPVDGRSKSASKP